jgi:four helix bundle protein
MKDFRDLQVWHKAYQLALQIYRATSSFPQHELYGLISQIRRAGVSIPANLAEGCCRQGDREFARFVQIAVASASELECLLLLARDLGYLPEAQRESLLASTVEVKRMLASLLTKLNADR